MLIVRAPYRISLFGSSTDHRSFSDTYGSIQIGFPFTQYSYLAIRRTPDILPYYTKVQYSQIETVDDNLQIRHNGVRGCLQYMCWTDPIEIVHFCDIPSGTGLGSSSAFIVGLLKGLHALNGTETNPKSLAKEAIFVERTLLNEPGGQKDQILCSTNTGLSSVEIDTHGDFRVKPLWVSKEFQDELLASLSLLYVGSGRESFKIASSLDKEEAIAGKLKLLDNAKEALNAFQSENIFGHNGIGELLNELWLTKRTLSPLVSNNQIDSLYDKAMENGALGMNLLGTGQTGFILVCSRPESKDRLIEALGLPEIKLGIDQHGPQVVLKT